MKSSSLFTMKRLILSLLIFNSGFQVGIAADKPNANSNANTRLYGEWPSSNNTAENLGVSNDNILTPANVTSLQPLWSTFQIFTPNALNEVIQSAPTIADGKVYVAEAGGKVKCYQQDGTLLWVSPQLKDSFDNPDYFDESPVLTKNFIFIAGQQMHKLSRDTGAEVIPPAVWDPILAPNIPSGNIEPSQLMLAGDKVIYGVGFTDETSGNGINFNYAHGEIIAFNQDDLSSAWRIDLTKANGIQYGPGSGTYGGGGVDEKRHLFFIGSGNQYEAPASPLSDSLLAIDYRNGEIVWSYQYVANDVWGHGTSADDPDVGQVFDGQSDLDINAHPQIFSFKTKAGVPGSSIDLVGARGKDGTYRIFTRDQADPNNVKPLVQIQLDPATSVTGGIQIDPVIKDDVLYIASSSFVNPANPSLHLSLDFLVQAFPPLKQFAALIGSTTTVRALNLRKLIAYGQSQLALGNNTATCVGNLYFPRCTGQLPSDIIKWETPLFPSAPFSSGGMTYSNGVLILSSVQGRVNLLDAANGAVVKTLVPGLLPFTLFGLIDASPALGGVSVANGKLFVPMGVNFNGTGLPFGGMTVYGLP